MSWSRSPIVARSRGVVHTPASSGALSPISSMAPSLRGGRFRLGSHFGGLRDLPHDFHDVLVGVEDVELPIGAVAAAEDLVDACELLLRAELTRVWLERRKRAAHECGD